METQSHNEEEEITPEELKSMKQNLGSKCDDIQLLLRNMVTTEKMMREDVKDLFIRDLDEDIECQGLTDKVLQDELALCGDKDYIRFLAVRGESTKEATYKLNLSSEVLMEQMVGHDAILPVSDWIKDFFRNTKPHLREDVLELFGEYFEALGNKKINVVIGEHPLMDSISDEQMQKVLGDLGKDATHDEVFCRIHDANAVSSAIELLEALERSPLFQHQIQDSDADVVVYLRYKPIVIRLTGFVLQGKLRAIDQVEPHVHYPQLQPNLKDINSKAAEIATNLVELLPGTNLLLHFSYDPENADFELIHISSIHPNSFSSSNYTWSDIAGLQKKSVGGEGQNIEVRFNKTKAFHQCPLVPYDEMTEKVHKMLTQDKPAEIQKKDTVSVNRWLGYGIFGLAVLGSVTFLKKKRT